MDSNPNGSRLIFSSKLILLITLIATANFCSTLKSDSLPEAHVEIGANFTATHNDSSGAAQHHDINSRQTSGNPPSNDQVKLGAENLVAAGYMFAEKTDQRLNLTDPIDSSLSDILDRDGPDMRPSRDFKDFDDISVNVSKRAWLLLHEHAQTAIADWVSLARPTIDEVLKAAGVSRECGLSVGEVFSGAQRMESWAIKLINSWGNFPAVGIFEGTYSEIGSFHTCVNIPENNLINHTHYCTLTYRPVMPSRRNYELVVRKEPRELLKLFDGQRQPPPNWVNGNSSARRFRHAFKDLLEHAQYHHYVYYKWGTCWPINCSPFDVRRVAKLMGKRNTLMNGPVKCFSKNRDDYEEPGSVEIGREGKNSTVGARKLKISIWDLNEGIFIWKPHFNRTQKVALAIIICATLFILCMTLIDLVFVRMPTLWRTFREALMGDKSIVTPSNNHTNNHDNSHSSCLVEAARTAAMELNPVSAHQESKNFSHRAFALASVAKRGEGENNHQELMVETKRELGQATVDETGRQSEAAKSTFMSVVDDCSIITNSAQFFRVSQGQLKNDILCLNGIRCITMIWIIMTHTMMYNDWSAFARTREIEKSLNSLINQPLFNGSYLVDTFFLLSGLLSAFTAFRTSKGLIAKFNSFAYIFGRWLRLTPQIFFVSMMFIVLPAISEGPHWFPLVGEYSENCVSNWWINVLHLQAFYDKEKMCNFVTWWISIDFFYHFFALAVIWIILLLGHKFGFTSIAMLVVSQVGWQTIRHYQLSLPPNVFSTIPQTGAMWTEMTLNFFWTPYTHAVPFFFGFYLGYLMALKKKLIARCLNPRLATICWLTSAGLLIAQSYSTYWWVTGKADYTRLVSTIFYTVCPIIWAGSLCWIIIACQYGFGGFVNGILSSRVFIILGKASYLVYLSHFQVLFMFYGNQNLLLEPSEILMFYAIVGNIFLSTLLGILLCIVFELPWLKTQRKLMKYV